MNKKSSNKPGQGPPPDLRFSLDSIPELGSHDSPLGTANNMGSLLNSKIIIHNSCRTMNVLVCWNNEIIPTFDCQRTMDTSPGF